MKLALRLFIGCLIVFAGNSCVPGGPKLQVTVPALSLQPGEAET